MTSQHRRRLSFAAAVAIIVLAFATAPVFTSDGVAGGLGVMALSAIAPLVVLSVTAYVWSANDREVTRRTGGRSSQTAEVLNGSCHGDANDPTVRGWNGRDTQLPPRKKP